ncbi:MAG: Flp pilus assembly protein CpaB [Thermacetogeniaceae bacterium]
MKANKRLLIVAVIIGLITVLALNYYIKDMQSETPAFADVSQSSVVVAKSTIPQHTRITSEMLTTESITEDAVHPEALKEINEAVGGISRSEIVKGEQVLGSRVATEERRASLSYRIPEHLRGISIPVAEVPGVSGYISPGDKVDVMVAYDDREINETLTVYTVVQNVLVLAAGEFTQEQDNEERHLVSTVTLGVTPAQAEVLAYANLRGTFHLTLRSPLDEEIVNLGHYSAENFGSFRER